MKYHLIAFVLGFLMDQIIGDPMNFPHPIRLIGNMIHLLDKKLLGKTEGKKRNEKNEFIKGIILCIAVLLVTVSVTGCVMFAAYKLHPYAGIAVEAILTCYILAAKSLRDESMKVYDALQNKTLEDARYAVSMIVGRDTAVLDKTGVTKAAVWASFACGVLLTVLNMFFKFIASPINAGAAAMIAGMIVVPIVSLLTPKMKKEKVDEIFTCLDETVTVHRRRSIEE